MISLVFVLFFVFVEFFFLNKIPDQSAAENYLPSWV